MENERLKERVIGPRTALGRLRSLKEDFIPRWEKIDGKEVNIKEGST